MIVAQRQQWLSHVQMSVGVRVDLLKRILTQQGENSNKLNVQKLFGMQLEG